MNSFVLVDCNNFYVSCERLFNPKLEHSPVLVLSNNDGCVISRSQEVKQLGIKMGDPFFKIRDFCQTHKVHIYSSNYRLYGDISQRIMSLLREAAEEIEIYSIDEAFLMFKNLHPEELEDLCITLRKKIKKWIGIPVSLGIAPTKTLAKVASKMAKKEQTGVFDLSSPIKQEKILRDFPIGDVWGVGSRTETKLKGLSIFTAGEFREKDPLMIRKKLGVVGERMLWELRGLSCLFLEEDKVKQTISCSRSFGKVQTELSAVAEALSTHVHNAFIKLREQKSCASAIYVYLDAVIDSQNNLRQHQQVVVSFPVPTNDTPQAISLAKRCLERLCCESYKYKKCGVVLLDIIPEAHLQPDLFIKTVDPKRRQLAATLDQINARFGKNTLFYGAMGVHQKWKMRSEHCSPCYTTAWNDLAIVT